MISDIEIITALESTATKTEAAEQLNISRQTLYNRLSDPKFKKTLEQYQKIKDDTLQSVMTSAQIEAIEALRGIIKGGLLTNDDDKLKACSILLKR